MVLEILAKHNQSELSGPASPGILASKGIDPGSYLHERTTSAFRILEEIKNGNSFGRENSPSSSGHMKTNLQSE